MADPAQSIFESLTSIGSIETLIEAGEAEGQYLECKSPVEPRLGPGLRAQLAEAVSGFGNSGGGVILWGVETQQHQNAIDVLTETVPIGLCNRLAQQIDIAIPTLTTPSVNAPPSRRLLKTSGGKQGLIVTYVPPSTGDPIQVNQTRRFHLRVGASFLEMPYETLKRMFLGSQAPDLLLEGPTGSSDPWVTVREDGRWVVPIVLRNLSSAIARDVEAVVSVVKDEVEHASAGRPFTDVSAVNPGRRIFTAPAGPIHRGLDIHLGNLEVKPKPRVRVLAVRVEVYSDRMRARSWRLELRRAKGGGVVPTVPAFEFLY